MSAPPSKHIGKVPAWDGSIWAFLTRDPLTCQGESKLLHYGT